MIGTIQMKKPVSESPDYYLAFYNMYNLLQISDAIVFEIFEEAKEAFQLTTENLLEKINTNNYAEELKAMFFITGIAPPANVIKMAKENRGTDTSYAHDLKLKNIEPFDWFRKTHEFLHLYAIFEQALKEFLLPKGYTNVTENVIIENFFEELDSQSSVFLRTLEFKTFGIIGNSNEVKAIWAYYTKMRNCLAHAGGRITKKVIDGFNGIKSNFGNAFNTIQNKEFLSLYFLIKEDEDYKLFDCDYLLGDIIHLDNNSLNLFRMFCVFIIEALVEI